MLYDNQELANLNYNLKDGEPSALRKEFLDGKVFDKLQDLFVEISNENNPKKRYQKLIDCYKLVNVSKNELEKMKYYKNEFDSMANFLNSKDLLFTEEMKMKDIDEKGSEYEYVYHTKRSISRSIANIREKI